jgi:hypothetical protein
MQDASGNKTPVRAKNVYLHPSGADIAIIELEDDALPFLSERDGTPSIIPSPLYRGEPQGLCGEVLHGAGYGYHGMAADEVLQEPNGNRYYYETSFNFVLESICFPFSENDPSEVSLSIDFLKERIEVLELLLLPDVMDLLQYTEQDKEKLRIQHIDRRASLKELSELSFETRINKHMSAETAFTGSICSGDSGSALFNKQGHVVAVITGSVKYFGSRSPLGASNSGELVYPFLDWIDHVTEGRANRHPVDDTWLSVLDSILMYIH